MRLRGRAEKLAKQQAVNHKDTESTKHKTLNETDKLNRECPCSDGPQGDFDALSWQGAAATQQQHSSTAEEGRRAIHTGSRPPPRVRPSSSPLRPSLRVLGAPRGAGLAERYAEKEAEVFNAFLRLIRDSAVLRDIMAEAVAIFQVSSCSPHPPPRPERARVRDSNHRDPQGPSGQARCRGGTFGAHGVTMFHAALLCTCALVCACPQRTLTTAFSAFNVGAPTSLPQIPAPVNVPLLTYTPVDVKSVGSQRLTAEQAVSTGPGAWRAGGGGGGGGGGGAAGHEASAAGGAVTCAVTGG